MTNPDPSREAFEKFYIDNAKILSIHLREWTDEELTRAFLERRQSGLYRADGANAEWRAWRAAMTHKDAELQQAHEARRQEQTELADMKEKSSRIGLDIDRALQGEVNEQSPIAGRLKLIAADAEEKLAAIPADAIAVNLVRHAGLDKHVARECEQIVRTLVGAKLWLPEVIDRAKAEAGEFNHWFDEAPKQEGST